MPSCPRAAIVALVCAIGATLAYPSSAHAQSYTYQGLADTRPASPFMDFGRPSINDAGDIAFAASLKNGGSGIYKWSAATHAVVTIFEDPTTNWLYMLPAFSNPALSPNGTVIFQYGAGRIWSGTGAGQPQIVIDENTQVPLGSLGVHPCVQPLLRSRSTDASGRAVIRCLVDDGPNAQGEGTYLARVGSIQPVCGFTGNGASERCFTDDWPVEVSGNVLAGIGADTDRFDQFGFPRQLLLRGSAAGLEVLLDPALDSALAFPNRLSTIGVNDQGRVAYDAYQNTAGGSGFAVFRIDSPGAPISLTDPRNFVYRDAHLPSVNGVGEVPFLDGLRNGIFMGPDPVANKVVARADTIPGYAIPGVITNISAVSFQHPGINRLGDVAFVAFLGDGTLVIARASPPTNHPPSVTFGDQSSPEGTPVTVQVVASDQDGDYPLTYGLGPTPANLAPAGTIAAAPPGLSIDTSSGQIVGTPAAGTAGNRYAVRITVSDSRGLITTVDIVWTITDVLPPPRVNVVASTNLVGEAIDVRWQNPSLDTAEEVWLGYSTTGILGPFQQWGFAPLSTTSLQFIDPLSAGRTYCFTAKGVVTRNGNRIFSVDSNIACTNYPQFTMSIENPGVISTPTSASFVITTNMPANLELRWPNTPPAGTQWSVTPDATNRVFTIQITNLPSAATQTSYSVTVLGTTRLNGLVASRTVNFVTTALPPPPPPGPIQVGNSSPLRVDARDFVRVSTTTMSIDVRLRNTSSVTAANVATVVAATTLELDPRDLSPRAADLVRQYCRIDPEQTVATCSPITVTPLEFGTVGRGQTSPSVSLTFPLAAFDPRLMLPQLGGPGVHARLRLAVTYDGLNGSFDLLPEVRPSLPFSAF